uniref:HECT domain-containing protein n=1 Tax=Strigamia maritima TaxID=126957 RepID=T1IPE6_STRMM
MFCWGNTVNGELGLGGIEEEHVLTPRELQFSKAWEVSRVACGENHTVFLTADGRVFTCGSNDMNQLGHVKPRKRPEQIDVLAAHVVRLVACGLHHTLVVNEWGQIFSWGNEAFGQLGNPGITKEFTSSPRVIRPLATKRVVQVACGANHSLALTDVGQLYAWGSNECGQLGLGVKGKDEPNPSLIKSLEGVPLAQIACGSEHSIALSKSGAVFSWGKNTFGQLGLNDELNREYPTLLRTLRSHKIKYISCGEDHTATLTKEGGVFTFGAGMYGQLGHNSIANEILPRKVIELMGSIVTQIACGRRHTLAYVASRGRIYSFGLGGSGQLGINSQRNCLTPMAVFGPWVSPSGSVPMETNDAESSSSTKGTKHFVLYRIFSGGDQCFVRVTYQKDEIQSDDYRVIAPLMQVLVLTNDKAKEFVRVGAAQTVPQDLMSYIESVFTFPACINASFLLKNDEHYGCSRSNPGIDIGEVRKFFHKVGRVQNEVISELIKNCLEKDLVSGLQPSPPDVEALRLYIVLPECHFFHNFANYDGLICSFGHALLSLKIEASKVVDVWWGHMGLSYLLNILQIYKSCVVNILNLPDTKNEVEMFTRNRGLEVSLRVLEKVNQSSEYKGDYHKDHPTVRIFWKVFHKLTLEDKKKFLLFLTGSDRIPISGMKSIKIYIQSTGGGEEFLPVAHTCFNLLDLPRYTTEEQLRGKLLQAIEHTQGFALV